MEREKVLNALKYCAEFECGNCPYKYLDSKDYPLRCIHTLIIDLNKIVSDEYQRGYEDGYQKAEAESYWDSPSPAGFNAW